MYFVVTWSPQIFEAVVSIRLHDNVSEMIRDMLTFHDAAASHCKSPPPDDQIIEIPQDSS